MTLMDGSFTLAAAQIEPRYYDKEGTVAKACRWIEKAGDAIVAATRSEAP